MCVVTKRLVLRIFHVVFYVQRTHIRECVTVAYKTLTAMENC